MDAKARPIKVQPAADAGGLGQVCNALHWRAGRALASSPKGCRVTTATAALSILAGRQARDGHFDGLAQDAPWQHDADRRLAAVERKPDGKPND